MKRLVCDVETTIFNKGHWADRRNKLVVLGIRDIDLHESYIYFYPTKKDIEEINSKLDECLFIGHNCKFDLHWCLNLGINISNIKVHDTQICEFLLESQRNPYNSLNDALTKYGFPLKLDVVKTEYWEKGIDTDAIPTGILREYLEYDLIGTENVFKEQWEQFTGMKL